MKEKFDVQGMSCAACSARVERTVNALPGVQEAQVNLLAKCMVVEFDETQIDEKEIETAVTNAGYRTSVAKSGGMEGRSEGKEGENPEEEALRNRLLSSVIFLLPLMYASMGHMIGLPVPGLLHRPAVMYIFQLVLSSVIVGINRKIFLSGGKAAIGRAPNMDTLIALGSGAAFIFAVFSGEMYFESAAMILTLVTLGKYLEERAKGKTSEALSKLIRMVPQTAVILKDGKEQEIPAAAVVPGDLVVSRPGEAIAVDGIVTEGFSTVDESVITGESMPVDKGKGDSVIGATINKSGYLVYRAERVGEDTAFSKIIRLVDEASSSKGPGSRIADKISGVFVPVVIGIAGVTFGIWMILGAEPAFALTAGISVLVISCPCALGLATPAAVMTGMGKGAEHGILFQSAEVLETAGKTNLVILDKTGTVTEGKPVVTDIYIPREGYVLPVDISRNIQDDSNAGRLLRIAGSIEAKSEHPLATAVVHFADEKKLRFSAVKSFEVKTGKGAQGCVDGVLYKVGTEQYITEVGLKRIPEYYRDKAEELRAQGKTVIFCADDREVLGMIAVADVVKKTAGQAVSALERKGIKTVMMTGDNRKTAEYIRKQVGIEEVMAEALPEDKERMTAAYQKKGYRVAFVGDGINDAPSLARADVGMAIGSGTDVALESADIVLMKNDLMDGVRAIKLSRIVTRNIKQNLFWAFFYNVIGIPLAAGILYPAFGLMLSPMIAAAAMSVSSVCVVLNALRIRGTAL